jgi:hypothetical protein
MSEWKVGVCVLTRGNEVIPDTHRMTEWKQTLVGNQMIVDLKPPPVWDPAPKGATHMALLNTTGTALFSQELPNGETAGSERISFQERG